MPTADTAVRPRRLPVAADIDTAAISSSDMRRVQKIIEYIEQRRPVWWRRGAFHTEQFRDEEPKWHILASRSRSAAPSERWMFTWTGLCGWKKKRQEILYGIFAFRVTTPRKDQRCRKCVAAQADLIASQTAAADNDGIGQHVRE